MTVAASVIAAFLLLTIVVQGWMVAIWYRNSNRSFRATHDRKWQPPTTIVLCLRGADPSLPDCLRSLASQLYDDYQILCVLDRADDPASDVVSQVQSTICDKRIEFLKVIVAKPVDGRCSLKNNALITALDSLEKRTEVIAFADADSIFDENWLSDLVCPLIDPAIAVSTGNRWYLPPDDRSGTLLRWLWHLAASVQMLVYRIPWGGSMAMRREFADQTGLAEIWSTALFDDTMLYSLARKHGKQIAILPQLLVPNRESIATGPARRWTQRQLLNMRLYHPAFKMALLHCLSTSFAIAVALGLFLVSVILGNSVAAFVTGIALLTYALFYGICLRTISRTGQRIVEWRHENTTNSHPKILKVCVAVVHTQLVYTLAMFGALLCRKARWRGVDYLIRRPHEIQLVNYRSMHDLMEQSADGNQSIEV